MQTVQKRRGQNDRPNIRILAQCVFVRMQSANHSQNHRPITYISSVTTVRHKKQARAEYPPHFPTDFFENFYEWVFWDLLGAKFHFSRKNLTVLEALQRQKGVEKKKTRKINFICPTTFPVFAICIIYVTYPRLPHGFSKDMRDLYISVYIYIPW